MSHPISAMALPNMTAENEKTDLLTSKDGPQLANDGSGNVKTKRLYYPCIYLILGNRDL